ncbi:MAG TPA: 5'-nucleotidase [Capsulimonadaceae bacterium]|jgi:2',3'-cyclic-nucleotide 2'-phosphodiesterase (5'-nucleotidase family)
MITKNAYRSIATVAVLALACAVSLAATVSNKTALDGTRANTSESNFGNLVADAARSQGAADAAIIPASELRPVVIPAGPVDSEKIVAALRASSDTTDTVVVLKLTGAQLKKAFERSVSRTPSPYEGFLQVSGLCVTYDTSKGNGSRIVDITIGGKSIQPGQGYNIATTRLLSDGALGYFEIWSRSDIANNTGVPLAKAVGDFAISRQPLNYATEGRIIGR